MFLFNSGITAIKMNQTEQLCSLAENSQISLKNFMKLLSKVIMKLKVGKWKIADISESSQVINYFKGLGKRFLLRALQKCNAGINLTSYHTLRANPRATNFYPSRSPPRGQVFSAKLRPPGRKRETKSPPPGIIYLVRMLRYQ